MQYYQCTVNLLDLPQEIIYKIFEYVIPSEFYCDAKDIPPSEEDDAVLRWFGSKIQRSQYGYIIPSNRLNLFNEFERLQNYLLIHRDLFYRNLIECHCNRNFIGVWKKILLMHYLAYNSESRSSQFSCTMDIKNLLNSAKTGDHQSVHKLVGEVLNRFNGSRTLLQTFFKVEFSGEETKYPYYVYQSYEIMFDILKSDDDSGIKKVEYLKGLLARCPSCTKNPKFFFAIIHQVSSFFVSQSIYSNEIRKIKKKSSELKSLKEFLLLLFSDCGVVPFYAGSIEHLRIIMATIKLVGLDDLFKQLMYKWVLNNPCNAGSHNAYLILFGNKNGAKTLNGFEYCILESYVVKCEFDELALVISKLEKESPKNIIGGVEYIISIFFKRYELFQSNLEENSQKLMNLIRACWNLFDRYCEESFILILESLVSNACRKALTFKDEKPIVTSIEYFYFELFSKKFLGSHLSSMDNIIEKSKILNQAIEHPAIFKHFMENMGNKKAYKNQLRRVCKDSSILSSILDCTAHFMGNSDNVTYSYKLRIESNLYDSYDLFEKRMKLVKEYLQNDSLLQKALSDKSTKFNKDIEKILRYCNTFDSIIPLHKTMNRIGDYLKTL
ncbi:hypothetical protein NAEGRDRAFT_63250 [Naegleria gruberi]|uniref:F-box domain-containing protein n=1 Tax=Naegleria gruberi TaxID=5762 RepID=D2V370_NAEGR|nr:uncharacterized protein NAEGRDRAFT_63250 [Naegleria gruberi]EFC48581.1 hypothetical protein NAEGRDRAFT_63250 [Naegleria gruberi]|eukprot:XP_002681325.1 hypothetical protein NAEGRDRAFT_63250 [Naegleria gruberi strain NEG-M]